MVSMSQDRLDSSHSRESIFGPESLKGTKKRNHIRIYYYTVYCITSIIRPFFSQNLILMKCFSDQIQNVWFERIAFFLPEIIREQIRIRLTIRQLEFKLARQKRISPRRRNFKQKRLKGIEKRNHIRIYFYSSAFSH